MPITPLRGPGLIARRPGAGSSPPPSTAGEAIGLLLILTKAS